MAAAPARNEDNVPDTTTNDTLAKPTDAKTGNPSEEGTKSSIVSTSSTATTVVDTPAPIASNTNPTDTSKPPPVAAVAAAPSVPPYGYSTTPGAPPYGYGMDPMAAYQYSSHYYGPQGFSYPSPYAHPQQPPPNYNATPFTMPPPNAPPF